MVLQIKNTKNVICKHLVNEFNKFCVENIYKIRKSIPYAGNDINQYSDQFQGDVLNSFEPTTEQKLKDIIKEYGIKTSTEDPIPSKVLSSIIDEVLPLLTNLVNKSLAEGSIDGVKQSVIDPLLKKSGLDAENRKNYRPVNNLVFFSKLIERVVLKRLDRLMNVDGL